MATSEHLRKLFGAFAKRDDPTFFAVAHELIADEEQKGHRLLARDLEGLLGNGPNGPRRQAPPNDVPVDKERGLPLVEVLRPDYSMDRLVLSGPIETSLATIIMEFGRRDILRSYGLCPKTKILFFGPPGCGKTITAKVLAGVLDLPLLYVRFDGVVSSYLGETAANLRRVFDYARRGSWVVLFDEFDAIGKGRDNAYEHGELKRVVNSLLQLMDGFSGESILIAATNHEFLLDPALWRRFDEIVRFSMPDATQRKHLLHHFLRGFRHEDVQTDSVASGLKGMSGGDLERICIEAIKHAVLDGRKELSEDDMDIGISRQRARVKLTRAGVIPARKTRRGKQNGENT